jgi:hypothetical protein
MTTSNKRHKQRKRKCSLFIIFFPSIHIDPNDTSQTVHNNDLYDLVGDHNCIAPYEICGLAIGLLSILMNRHIIDMSFSKLYQQR